jgi:hypothetical protein
MSTSSTPEQEQGQTAGMYELTVPGDDGPRYCTGIIRHAESAGRAEPEAGQ